MCKRFTLKGINVKTKPTDGSICALVTAKVVFGQEESVQSSRLMQSERREQKRNPGRDSSPVLPPRAEQKARGAVT